jgi:hypothetical protein
MAIRWDSISSSPPESRAACQPWCRSRCCMSRSTMPRLKSRTCTSARSRLVIEMGEEADGQHMLPEDYGALYLQFATTIHRLVPEASPAFESVNMDVEVWPDRGPCLLAGRFPRLPKSARPAERLRLFLVRTLSERCLPQPVERSVSRAGVSRPYSASLEDRDHEHAVKVTFADSAAGHDRLFSGKLDRITFRADEYRWKLDLAAHSAPASRDETPKGERQNCLSLRPVRAPYPQVWGKILTCLASRAVLPRILDMVSNRPANCRHGCSRALDPLEGDGIGESNHKHESRVWALIVWWGVVTLIVGYVLWTKVSGS